MAQSRSFSFNTGAGESKCLAVGPNYGPDRAVVVGCGSTLRLYRFSYNSSINSNVSEPSAKADISELDNICVRTAGIRPGSLILNDIAWNMTYSSKIATAGTSGDIFVVNVEAAMGSSSTRSFLPWMGGMNNDNSSSGRLSQGLAVDKFRFIRKNPTVYASEQERSVNRISWSIRNPNLLGAAYQDGTVKLFDCRSSPCAISIIEARLTGARDIQFNPIQENLVGTIFDNGCWCVWDNRNLSKPTQTVTGHSTHGYAIAWSLTRSNILATGSHDKTIKVWNIHRDSSSDSGNSAGNIVKPEVVIHTSSTTNRLAWRPGHGHENHLASSSTERGEISIWNIKNPTVPYCKLQGRSESSIDFEWVDFNSNLDRSDIDSEVTSKESVLSRSGYDEVISVSKDGFISLGKLSKGFFPRQHIAPHVTAISTVGHVVSQRSKPPQAAATISASASDVSMPSSSRRYRNHLLGSGILHVGVANVSLSSLEVANTMRSLIPDRAEGNIFDPAMLDLLARHYKTGWEGLGPMDACKHNKDVALKAGLRCRAAVWETALIFLSSGPANQTNPSTSISYGSILDSFAVPFALDLLEELLNELLEGGDCLHFVYLSEILYQTGLAEKAMRRIAESRYRETYLALIDMLMKHKLFLIASAIIKVSRDENISKMFSPGVSIKTSCSSCSKEIIDNPIRSPWCSRCKQCLSLCCICQQPVRGMYLMCPVCSHGGHKSCLERWFKLSKYCPTGCEHQCCNALSITDDQE